MSVAAVSMCKDEADIAEATLRHLAGQVDFLIVADNGSTDGTREILDLLAREITLTVLDDEEIGYYQSRKMTALAHRAAEQGAEWVIPFDFDEWWYSPFGEIRDVLVDAGGKASIATAQVFDHVATAADDTAQANPTRRLGWRRREPCPLFKVACRPVIKARILQGNHGADFAADPAATLDGQLIVRHFPNRSVEQLVRKVRNGAAAYAATDLPEHQGKHWRDWGRLLEAGGAEAIAELFYEWYFSEDPEGDRDLIFDPAP